MGILLSRRGTHEGVKSLLHTLLYICIIATSVPVVRNSKSLSNSNSNFLSSLAISLDLAGVPTLLTNTHLALYSAYKACNKPSPRSSSPAYTPRILSLNPSHTLDASAFIHPLLGGFVSFACLSASTKIENKFQYEFKSLYCYYNCT